MYVTALCAIIFSISLFTNWTSSVSNFDVQGGPATVMPTYIFDGNIWMHK